MINLKNKKLLIISPHPDDEIIGCAGLIQKIKAGKGKVYILFLTNGDTTDFSKKGLSKEKDRIKEIEKVVNFLKIDGYEIALPGADYHLKLDVLGQNRLMEIIERSAKLAISKVKPDIVALPSHLSYNQDHRAAAFVTHAALRPSAKNTKHIPNTILVYEEAADLWTLNSQPSPNFFLPLTEKELGGKLSALKLYKSQNRPYPNMRSTKMLEKLASLRGGIIGEKFAESFNIIRTSSK